MFRNPITPSSPFTTVLAHLSLLSTSDSYTSAISNMSDIIGPYALGALLEKLNGTISKVSKLRQSLDDLESELGTICQLCENVISTCTATTTTISQLMVDDRILCNLHHLPDMVAIPSSATSFQDLERSTHASANGIVREQKGELGKQKGESTNSCKEGPSLNPTIKSAMKVESKGLPANTMIQKGGNPLSSMPFTRSQAIPALRAQVQGVPGTPTISERISPQQPPRSPTLPSPFPKHLDLSSYRPELKREGHDWFILFNPSPKVEKVLNVNLEHALRHESGVVCVRFSQDGKWLATGCWRTAQIYAVKGGVLYRVFDHKNDVYIWSVCFSPNGKYLATGADDKQIRIWNIANQEIHKIIEGHPDPILSLHFTMNGRYIISGPGDKSVCIWDVRDKTFKVLTIDGHYLSHNQSTVLSVAISPDGRYIAAGSANAIVNIWEVTTGLLVQTLRGHRDRVRCVAFTPDGKGLISGSWDATLKYWDISGLGAGASDSKTSSLCLMNMTGHKDYVLSTAVSHDGNWVVSGSQDRNVLFWDARTGVVQCMLSGHKNSVYKVDLSPIGNILATAGLDGQVRIWGYG